MKKTWRPLVFCLLVSLPVAGNWARRGGDKGCALDGARIEPLYRVRVEDRQAQSHEFCCVRCAEVWLSRQDPQPWTICVTDELSGREIPAASAHYVRSLVPTGSGSANRVHVFQELDRAEKHAQTCQGTIIGLPEAFHQQ
jgi:hypothetical protein